MYEGGGDETITSEKGGKVEERSARNNGCRRVRGPQRANAARRERVASRHVKALGRVFDFYD